MIDTLPSNKELHAMRIGYAQAAIDGYIAATPDKQHQNMEETLTDILTDLMHWAREQSDVAFTVAIHRASTHFQDEAK